MLLLRGRTLRQSVHRSQLVHCCVSLAERLLSRGGMPSSWTVGINRLLLCSLLFLSEWSGFSSVWIGTAAGFRWLTFLRAGFFFLACFFLWCLAFSNRWTGCAVVVVAGGCASAGCASEAAICELKGRNKCMNPAELLAASEELRSAGVTLTTAAPLRSCPTFLPRFLPSCSSSLSTSGTYSSSSPPSSSPPCDVAGTATPFLPLGRINCLLPTEIYTWKKNRIKKMSIKKIHNKNKRGEIANKKAARR